MEPSARDYKSSSFFTLPNSDTTACVVRDTNATLPETRANQQKPIESSIHKIRAAGTRITLCGEVSGRAPVRTAGD
jgi:hypothetical protein